MKELADRPVWPAESPVVSATRPALRQALAMAMVSAPRPLFESTPALRLAETSNCRLDPMRLWRRRHGHLALRRKRA